jgi:hypothetical protein
MAQPTAQRSKSAANRRASHNEGVIPQLARAVREVEASAQRGKATPINRTKFHVIALLMREERSKAKSDPDMSEHDRAETLKRLDGIASILAKTAARDTSLITLLEPTAPITDATRSLRRKLLEHAGVDVEQEDVQVSTAEVIALPP